MYNHYMTRRQQELLLALWNAGVPIEFVTFDGVWMSDYTSAGEAFGYQTAYALVDAGFCALGYDEDVLRSADYAESASFDVDRGAFTTRKPAAMTALGLTPAGEAMARLLLGDW